MGQEISAAQFDKSNFNQFHQKLKQETTLLKKMIEQNACSMRAPVAGFEIEAWLLDSEMQAMPINSHFLSNFNKFFSSWFCRKIRSSNYWTFYNYFI